MNVEYMVELYNVNFANLIPLTCTLFVKKKKVEEKEEEE